MDLQSFVTSLTPDQIEALKAALGDNQGRSPIRPHQRHDLRLLPTKEDPCPTYFWSAEAPRNAGDLTRTTPYPRLLWHGKTGIEVTAADPKAHAAFKAEGYVDLPPANAEKPEPIDIVREQLDSLSPEDRKLVLHNAHAAQLDNLKNALLGLTEAERRELAAAALEPKARKTA